MNDIKNISKTYYKSEIGALEITGSEAGILSILFVDDVAETGVGTPACLQECVTQLDEYFKGERKEFSLKLLPVGSDFQKKSLAAIAKNPLRRNDFLWPAGGKNGKQKSLPRSRRREWEKPSHYSCSLPPRCRPKRHPHRFRGRYPAQRVAPKPRKTA